MTSNADQNFTIHQKNIDLGVKNTTIAIIQDVQISQDDPQIDEWRQAAEDKAKSLKNLDDDPILAGYQALYAQLGYKKRDVMPAAQGLIKLIQKRGSMPRINNAVDLYNTVVVEKMLGIGAHDLAVVHGPVVFTLAEQEETFIPIGRKTAKVSAGDFLYRDSQQILCRLAAYDCDDAKLTTATKNILLVSEGNKATTQTFVENAMEEACSRITAVCGGSYRVFHPAVIANGFAAPSEM